MNLSELIITPYIIILGPAVIGCGLWLFPEKLKNLKGLITFLVSALMFYMVLNYSSFTAEKLSFPGLIGLVNNNFILKFLRFNIDSLSRIIILFISFFGMVISLYSLKFVNNSSNFKAYYSKFLLTLSAAFGVVLVDSFLTFTLFWGFLGITLYRFLRNRDEASAGAAKKSFILIGASDSILILGIGLLWLKTGTLYMSEMNIPLQGTVAISAFIGLLIASLTKAGAFPVHTWVPDYAESAPASVSAFLPASLDKLLGIYFLVRICMNIFILNNWAKLLLLIIGSISIITAVMMALMQHNYKKLLGYHAVSQVGYMVTGIGIGSPLGIAGGIFHMLNNTLYKSGLFLTSGSVEKQTHETDLDNLGGLIISMPITFFSTLIFALSISGIPPFNGFVSKWMIYQGIVEMGKGSALVSKLWIVWLGAAVIGSALTLASFIKLIGGIFLGKAEAKFKNIKEVSIIMWLPAMIITFLCIGFGIWGTSVIVPKLIIPISGEISYPGLWDSKLIGLLILAGIIFGLFIYFMGTIRKVKRKRHFVGGEPMSKEMAYPSIEFYKTLNQFKLINWIYQKAKDKYFDIYFLSKNLVLWFSKILSSLHNGILTAYILWALIGLGIIFIILV